MKQESILRNFMLQPLFLDVMSLQSAFTHISFEHVYRDKNKTIYGLSKVGLELEKRSLESLRESSKTKL
jgi:hypothetical protein